MTRYDGGPQVEHVSAHAYKIPTERRESDGTLEWDSTTCVVVRAEACGVRGIGYTYSHAAVARFIDAELAPLVEGSGALSTEHIWSNMLDAVRDLGRHGMAAHAISAVDIALWDLKAKLLDLSFADLWGRVRHAVPACGSGGFTSYEEDDLREQLGRWVVQGLGMVKIKVGRRPDEDLHRVRMARDAIGPTTALFVDAGGAYRPHQAVSFAEAFARHGVQWLEEPVAEYDLEGLGKVRARAPAGMRIAAGRYGCHPVDFRRLLDAGAVDVLLADATRCLGFTGFRKIAALSEAYNVQVATHSAPALHAQLGVVLRPIVHVEYFYDHIRVEQRLFQSTPRLDAGALSPDPSAPGLGLEMGEQAAARFAA